MSYLMVIGREEIFFGVYIYSGARCQPRKNLPIGPFQRYASVNILAHISAFIENISIPTRL